MSGANNIPLGRLNPAIGAGSKISSLLKPSYMSSNGSSSSSSHGGGGGGSHSSSSHSSSSHGGGGGSHSSSSHNSSSHNSSSRRSSSSTSERRSRPISPEEDKNDRKKRRRSRWQGDEKEKTFIPGMPTVLPSNMSTEQEEAYLLQLQIEEMSRRLRSNDLGIPPNPEDRSPSPEPIYNNEGKRLNTREYRTRKKLEDNRHGAIQKMMKLNPEYKPPVDYKPPIVKVSDKVMIPQEEHPDINFVGLLIGPRGNTLKSMEKETGAKIIIRGKGSVKEGKVGRKDGGPMPGEDEPLHAYVTASDPEHVTKAVLKIKDIIRQGVEVPEGQNDLRRMQLRELALLNGTLRESDGPKCSNCGSNAHKSWQCQDKPNVTNNVICSSCGGAGHIAKDCRQRQPGTRVPGGNAPVDRQKIDEEYMSLMAELGEGPAPPKPAPNQKPIVGGSQPVIRSLFDTPVGPPRAIAAPPPMGAMGPRGINPNNAMPMHGGPGGNEGGSGNMPPNSMGGPQGQNWNQSGGPPGQNFNQRPMGPPSSGANQSGSNQSGPNRGNQSGGNGGGGPGGAPVFNQPPPFGWRPGGGPNQGPQNRDNRSSQNEPPNQSNQGGPQNQQNQSGNFRNGPPPSLLSAPPPPPPSSGGPMMDQQWRPHQGPGGPRGGGGSGNVGSNNNNQGSNQNGPGPNFSMGSGGSGSNQNIGSGGGGPNNFGSNHNQMGRSEFRGPPNSNNPGGRPDNGNNGPNQNQGQHPWQNGPLRSGLGPVPPPRPCPPPGWTGPSWTGPNMNQNQQRSSGPPQSMGPPAGMRGPRPSGVDIGALLSAPPPPPPS